MYIWFCNQTRPNQTKIVYVETKLFRVKTSKWLQYFRRVVMKKYYNPKVLWYSSLGWIYIGWNRTAFIQYLLLEKSELAFFKTVLLNWGSFKADFENHQEAERIGEKGWKEDFLGNGRCSWNIEKMWYFNSIFIGIEGGKAVLTNWIK